jgi:hypothetical protein
MPYSRRSPTRIGDVLILWTAGSFTAYAVGQVFTDGQRDFSAQTHAKVERDGAAAVALAKTILVPGHRIFIRNIDKDVWSEVSNGVVLGNGL